MQQQFFPLFFLISFLSLNILLSAETHEGYLSKGYTHIYCEHKPTGKRKFHVPVTQKNGRFTKGGNVSTDIWAGYAAGYNGSSYATYVQGTWNVPTIFPGASTSNVAIWVGIDGLFNPTVEQLGINLGAITYAWYEQYPQGEVEILGFPINVGDSITATVEYTGNNQYNMSLANNTQQYFTTFPTFSGSPTPLQAGVEWIAETPTVNGTPSTLSQFSPLTFTNCAATINGTTGTISDPAWPNTAITLARNDVLASPSSLSPDGSSFSVQWESET